MKTQQIFFYQIKNIQIQCLFHFKSSDPFEMLHCAFRVPTKNSTLCRVIQAHTKSNKMNITFSLWLSSLPRNAMKSTKLSSIIWNTRMGIKSWPVFYFSLVVAEEAAATQTDMRCEWREKSSFFLFSGEHLWIGADKKKNKKTHKNK